jgi:hypothetical protein
MDGPVMRVIVTLAVALLGLALAMLVVGVLLASADPARAAEILVEWPIERVATLTAAPLAALGMGLYPVLAAITVAALRRVPWSITAHAIGAGFAALIATGVWMLSGEAGAAALEINGGLTSTALRLLAGALLASVVTSALARSVDARPARRTRRAEVEPLP